MKMLTSILQEERAGAYEAGWKAALERRGEVSEAVAYEAEREGYARGYRRGWKTASIVAVVIFFILTRVF
jgi:hypothetical protein